MNVVETHTDRRTAVVEVVQVGWRVRFAKEGCDPFDGVVSQLHIDSYYRGHEHCRVGMDDGTSRIGMLNGSEEVTVLDTSGDALARQLEAMEART